MTRGVPGDIVCASAEKPEETAKRRQKVPLQSKNESSIRTGAPIESGMVHFLESHYGRIANEAPSLWLRALKLILVGSQTLATADGESTIEPLVVSPSAMLLFAIGTQTSNDDQVSVFDLKNGKKLELCDVKAWGFGARQFFTLSAKPEESDDAVSPIHRKHSMRLCSLEAQL